MKPCATGNRARGQEVAEDPEEFKKALEEFQNDKFAASNQATHKARVQWWLHRAKSLDVTPFPLTVQTIDMAGALLNVLAYGQYRSSAMNFAALKREHVLLSHPWADDLTLAIKDAIRSRVRGIGQASNAPLQIESGGLGCGVVSLYLPASKTDSKGEGALLWAAYARPYRVCAQRPRRRGCCRPPWKVDIKMRIHSSSLTSPRHLRPSRA